jgi:hypothetical protein
MATLDRRRDPGFPIARYEFSQQSWASGVTTATTEDIVICGTIIAISVEINDNTGNRTLTLALADADSAALYSQAGIPENATTWYDAESSKSTPDANFNPIPVNGTITGTFTPSGDPGSGGMTADVTLYVR